MVTRIIDEKIYLGNPYNISKCALEKSFGGFPKCVAETLDL